MKKLGQYMAWGIAILVLMGMIIGGGLLITHSASWSLDDATIIQSTVGSGEMMDVYDEPGFQPRVGRLFPLAYMHENLVLLFEDGYIDAKPFYILHALLWCLFIVVIFVTSYYILTLITDKFYIRLLVALVAVLIVGQRCIYDFSQLWTTISADELLAALISLLYIIYCRTSKWAYGLGALCAMLYFAFCIEINSIVPFVMGSALLLFTKKKWMGWGSLGIVALYAVAYCTMILPGVSEIYDSSHGASTSLIQNAFSMVLLQKLLIVAFGLLIWRMYRVFIKKGAYRDDTDTLLAIGCAYAVGGFVMRLNWGLYYNVAILFTIPSLLSELNFSTKRAGIISGIVVLMIGGYYTVKYPKLVKAIYHNKEANAVDMQKLDTYIRDAKNIVWYVNEADAEVTDNFYLRCHVIRNIRHAEQDKEFEFKEYNSIEEGDIILSPKEQDACVVYPQIRKIDSLAKLNIYKYVQ